jgi:hypothetical protein
MSNIIIYNTDSCTATGYRTTIFDEMMTAAHDGFAVSLRIRRHEQVALVYGLNGA